MTAPKEVKTCQFCKYFVQHYIRRAERYYPINDGHCVHPRNKLRTMGTPACRNFVAGNREVEYNQRLSCDQVKDTV